MDDSHITVYDILQIPVLMPSAEQMRIILSGLNAFFPSSAEDMVWGVMHACPASSSCVRRNCFLRPEAPNPFLTDRRSFWGYKGK